MNTLVLACLFLAFCQFSGVSGECSRDKGDDGQDEMTTQSENSKTDYDVKVFYKMMTEKHQAHPTPPVGILFY